MKVCIISNVYEPFARGGAEQVVKKTVTGLLAAGHEVVLITAVPKEHAGMTKPEPGLTIHRITPSNIFFYTNAHKHSVLARLLWHVRDIFHTGSARSVWQILKQEQPDVVHTHNLMGLGFLIPLVVRWSKVRHLHTVHDVQLVEPSGIIPQAKAKTIRYNGPHTALYTALMKWLMGSPDVVISPSHFLLSFYKNRRFFPHSQLQLLRNPVTLPEQSTHVHNDTFRMLYLGQVETHKGVEVLLRAVYKLQGDWQLTIAGDGAKLGWVHKRSRGNSRIQVLGRVERSALPALFAKTDVLVVPSLCYENSPTVIFESFSYEVPVVASNVEGIAELIVQGENGYTFATGNAQALVTALHMAMEEKDTFREMGAHARESLQSLVLDEYMETLLGLYRKDMSLQSP